MMFKCPFCGKAKILVRHKPSVITKKRSITATLGTRYVFSRSAEVFEATENCPKCGKTKKEIEKRLKEGRQPTRESILKRMRKAGLDPEKIRL